MADTSDFRNGLVLQWNNDLWQIVEFMHVKPGKGGAFVRSKLKNIRTGKVVDETWRAGAPVETARVERRTYQFLYEDDMGLHFMNTDTYDQIMVSKDVVPGRPYLKEGGNLDLLVHAETEKVLNSEISPSVELVVAQTDPGIKGNTATGATKPAVVESGATVQVPLFINEGDVIRVNTGDGSYITRVSTS